MNIVYFVPPTNCPECNSVLKMDGEYLICTNSFDCPAQISGCIKQWITKLGIKEWGNSAIEALCESGLVEDPSDLYNLSYDELSSLQMSGRVVGRKAEVMLENLHAKKELPLYMFIGSLNIPMNSRSMCKIVQEAGYDSLEKMENATVRELALVHRMGEIKAEKFVEGIKGKKEIIERLLDGGITIKGLENKEGIMNGKTVEYRKHTDKDIYPFLLVDPLCQNSMFQMEKYKKTFYGMKINPSFHQTEVDNPIFFPFYKFAEQNSVPVLVHCGRNAKSHIRYLMNAANMFPKIKFIAAHLGGTAADLISEALFLLREEPTYNIYMDTSNGKLPLLVREAVETLGSDKVLYGSDEPYADMRIQKKCVDLSGLSQSFIHKIFYKNAESILLEREYKMKGDI